jgi:hypothetical protein
MYVSRRRGNNRKTMKLVDGSVGGERKENVGDGRGGDGGVEGGRVGGLGRSGGTAHRHTHTHILIWQGAGGGGGGRCGEVPSSVRISQIAGSWPTQRTYPIYSTSVADS